MARKKCRNTTCRPSEFWPQPVNPGPRKPGTGSRACWRQAMSDPECLRWYGDQWRLCGRQCPPAAACLLHVQRDARHGHRYCRRSGQSGRCRRVGELVLRQPSIGLSRGIWKDPERYIETYWSMFPELWRHGDWASRDEDGLWYVHGRSDDTIQVAGKRRTRRDRRPSHGDR